MHIIIICGQQRARSIEWASVRQNLNHSCRTASCSILYKASVQSTTHVNTVPLSTVVHKGAGEWDGRRGTVIARIQTRIPLHAPKWIQRRSHQLLLSSARVDPEKGVEEEDEAGQQQDERRSIAGHVVTLSLPHHRMRSLAGGLTGVWRVDLRNRKTERILALPSETLLYIGMSARLIQGAVPAWFQYA